MIVSICQAMDGFWELWATEVAEDVSRRSEDTPVVSLIVRSDNLLLIVARLLEVLADGSE